MKDVVLEEVKKVAKDFGKKYNKKEEVIQTMILKTIELGFNIEEAENFMEKFLKNVCKMYASKQ